MCGNIGNGCIKSDFLKEGTLKPMNWTKLIMMVCSWSMYLQDAFTKSGDNLVAIRDFKK